jgi:hypothetical protein
MNFTIEELTQLSGKRAKIYTVRKYHATKYT